MSVQISIGILPGLLWTIFVGATFGTINARGVDGNQEFDSNSLRKGVVLGLGIGLGVMGLIGTGIYARQELTKIILAEQALEQQDNSFAEEARRNSDHENQDLENPQLGDSFHGNNDERFHDNTNISSDNSNKNDASFHNGSFTEPIRDASPIRDTPWSAEAIALELPIVPNIFRRRVGSCEQFDSNPTHNNNDPVEQQHHHQQHNQQQNLIHQQQYEHKRQYSSTDEIFSSDTEITNDTHHQQSRQFELHFGERILDQIPYKWEKGENNRYHLTNRPRSNTDPIICSQAHIITPMDSSSREGDNKEEPSQEGMNSLRRLHSLADFESFRVTTSAERRNSSPDDEMDREWFWIWD